MYAQLCKHVSITKLAYNYEESLLFYYNYITLSPSLGHVTFIASRSCENLVGLGIVVRLVCLSCSVMVSWFVLTLVVYLVFLNVF